jgi:glutathione S-transferase
MITLIKYAPAFGLADASPFAIKTEVLLKLAAVPYQIEIATNPRRGPKGKLPAVLDDGALIGDSEIIRWHLERKYGADFDKGLSEVERARAHAYARMLEERTYWALIHSRWIEAANWPLTREALFAGMPAVVRSFVPTIARRQVRGYLHAHGLGRHSREELYRMGCADVRAVATELGDKPYFLGAEPKAVDATVFGMIASILLPPIPSPLRDEAAQHANLAAYCRRMRGRFYPEM